MLKSFIAIAVQAVVRLLSSILSLKVISYYAGPSGLAVVAQLQGVLQIAAATTSSVTTSGVVKYVADDEYDSLQVVMSATFLLVIVSSFLTIFFVFFSAILSKYLFDSEWVIAISLVPIAAFFLAFNNCILSYYNGIQNYRKFSSLSIAFSVSIAMSAIALSFFFQREGAIYSVLIAPITVGFIPFAMAFTRFKFRYFKIDSELLKKLSIFSSAAIVSAILNYGGHIFIRDSIANDISIDFAGVWYAATKLSEVYMGLISVVFSTLLLPKYSAKTGILLFKEVRVFFCLAILFVPVLLLIVYFLSDFGVNLIFGDKFGESAAVIRLYVIGDAIKILSWVLLYLLLAKSKIRLFFIYEIITAILYVVLTVFMLNEHGFLAMPYGYIIQSGISFLLIVFIVIFNKNLLFGIFDVGV